MRNAARIAAAGLTVVALAATACAARGDDTGVATLGDRGGASGTTPSPSVDPEDALQEFAECMRDHGVDVEVRTDGPEGGVSIEIVGDEVPGEDTMEADEACRDLLPDDLFGEAPSPEEQQEIFEQSTRFAECMREQGIDWPDPERAENGGIMFGPGEGVDLDDPELREAEERCRPLLEMGEERAP